MILIATTFLDLNSTFLIDGPETEQGIFEQVLHGDLDFSSAPWPSISESAKDLVRRMLVRDPKKRPTAHEVLCEFFSNMTSQYSEIGTRFHLHIC